MTENEAKERCDLLINSLSVNNGVESAFCDDLKGYVTFTTMRGFAQTCKKALEEVQQYRAIGTPEELKAAMKYVYLAKKHGTVGQVIENCVKYEEIGTPEECRKSLEICKAMVERNITPDDMENYMKFEDECIKQGFTLVGLLKAGEKHEVMEPIRMDKCTCQSCGTHNEVWKKRRNTLPSDIVYCWHCGQAVEIKRSDK